MLRLGVIGHGTRASGFIKHCLRDIDPDIRVVGLLDTDPEGATARLDDCDRDDVALYDDVDSLMRKGNLDGVLVGTRCNMHTPYAVQLAQYDVPLFLEKPVAITMDQATELERAFRSARCPVVVSFPLRVSPLCEMCRQRIEQGDVGDPVHIVAVNYPTYGTVYWEEPYRDYAITGGLFLQKATHDLDYMAYLVDKPIVRVAAMGTFQHVFGGDKPAELMCSECDETETCLESPENRRRNAAGRAKDHLCVFSKGAGNMETGTNEDCSSVLVEFEGGAHGVYTQVFFGRRSVARRGAAVSGYMGTVEFDWAENRGKVHRYHQPFTDTIEAGEGMSHFGGDAELSRDFIKLMQGNATTSRTPIETGLASAYACLAARQSALEGRFVEVRQVGEV